MIRSLHWMPDAPLRANLSPIDDWDQYLYLVVLAPLFQHSEQVGAGRLGCDTL